MKTTRILFFIFLFIPIFVQSGEIYGTIKGVDGNPLTNKVVQIIQNDKVVASDTTDANGYFTIDVKQVGKLKLEIVGYNGATFDVVSANKSTRYNLLLNRAGDKWILKTP